MSVNIVNEDGTLKKIAGGTLYADAPIGAIVPYGGVYAPSGWLLCQGQAVSRTTYADLFAAIGTAFGAGDGSTTFNIPDLREAAPVGAGQRATGVAAHDVYDVGTFKDDQMQTHNHPYNNNGNGNNLNAYDAYPNGIGQWGSGVSLNTSRPSIGNNTGRSGTTTHGKQLGVNYIIKAEHSAVPLDFADIIPAPVDEVQKENTNPVTSNAVAEELDNYLGNSGAQLLKGALNFNEDNVVEDKNTGFLVLGKEFDLSQKTTMSTGAILLGDGSTLANSTWSTESFLIAEKGLRSPSFSIDRYGALRAKSIYVSNPIYSHNYNFNGASLVVGSTMRVWGQGDGCDIEAIKLSRVWKIFNVHNAYNGDAGTPIDGGEENSVSGGCGIQFGKNERQDITNPVIYPIYYYSGVGEENCYELDSCNIGGYSGDHHGSDGKVDFGSANVRWKQIYAVNSTISTSDRNKKKEIEYFSPSSTWSDSELVTFVNDLKPCTYKLIDNQSNRPHHGLIAQDVEETLVALNKDHAAFIKTPIPVEVEKEETHRVKEVDPETGEEKIVMKTKTVRRSEIPEYPSYDYSLRYEEFIPDLIRYCQLLEARVKELENKIGE